ncbi:MAG: KTSC domain-containing protein [Bacteroidia bacterium]
MIRHHIVSDFIKNVGYDKDKMILEVELKNDEVYAYYELPIEVYDEFMGSKQKRDKYFKDKIETKYKSIRSR